MPVEPPVRRGDERRTAAASPAPTVAGVPEIHEDELILRARERGLALDRARAVALRPQLESLLERLARLAATLPAGVAPPPDVTLRSGPSPGDGR